MVLHISSSPADVVEGLWGGNDVEGRGDSAPLLEVGDPQLGARELPLGVRLLLGGQSLALDQDQPEPTRHEICKRCRQGKLHLRC